MSRNVEITEVAAGDLEEITRFLRREAAADVGEIAAGLINADQLRWFAFENPARGPGVPLGWLARDRAGELLGVKLCVPQRFRCRGEVHVFLLGGAWYVAAHARGVGLDLMKRYVDRGASHVLYTTTVNETSAQLMLASSDTWTSTPSMVRSPSWNLRASSRTRASIASGVRCSW